MIYNFNKWREKMNKKLLLSLSLAFGLTVSSFGSNAANVFGSCGYIAALSSNIGLNRQVIYTNNDSNNTGIIINSDNGLCIITSLSDRDMALLGPILAEVQSGNLAISVGAGASQISINVLVN